MNDEFLEALGRLQAEISELSREALLDSEVRAWLHLDFSGGSLHALVNHYLNEDSISIYETARLKRRDELEVKREKLRKSEND